MAITRVEIKDFLVFKGEFTADFCKGVNVLIGANGTGKTTLLREMYYAASRKLHHNNNNLAVGEGDTTWIQQSNYSLAQLSHFTWSDMPGVPNERVIVHFDDNKFDSTVYIPEKDIFEHARGLLPFIELKQTSFSQIYKDAIISAQDIPLKYHSELQKRIGETIEDIVGGVMEWVQSDGMFYTIRKDGLRIPFSLESSGYKKLAYLGLLVTCGQLGDGTALFWDEPENSLNPEHIRMLAEIILELSRNGVQFFIATHDELFASYIDILREDNDSLLFYSLYKDSESEQIKRDISDRFDLLTPNNLSLEQAKVYECELERAFKYGKR